MGERFAWVLGLLALTLVAACAGPPPGQSNPAAAAVTPAATAGPAATPIRLEELSVVTAAAATGHYANAWGGHQSRIVRTAGGVFTAYLAAPAGRPDAREFHVARQTADGWRVVHRGPAAGEPVHLVRGPDDRVYVISWQGAGRVAMWGTGPGDLTFTEIDVPGPWHPGDPLYSAAGISPAGYLYLLASEGGEVGGRFQWAYRTPDTGRWSDLFAVEMDYRHAYAYVLPGPERQLTVVAGRDVIWEALGYQRPDPNDHYAFNALRYWHTGDAGGNAFRDLLIHEEKPTPAHPAPATFNNYQGDAYLDTRGQTHVIYLVNGASTGGLDRIRHAVIAGGRVVADTPVPGDPGAAGLIIQDSAERHYFIQYVQDSSADEAVLHVYPALDATGTRWGDPVAVSLQGHVVRYAGVTLAAPRGGTPLADFVDGAYPSGDNGEAWVYFRLRLR